MTVLIEPKFLSLDKEPSMTTLEIAELTGKRVDHVVEKVRELSVSGVVRGLPEIRENYERSKKGGRPMNVYRLNKEESINVVANLCPLFTQKIIKRWQELEHRLVEPTYDQLQELSVEMKVSERIGQIGSELMNKRKREKLKLVKQEKRLLTGCQLCLGLGE